MARLPGDGGQDRRGPGLHRRGHGGRAAEHGPAGPNAAAGERLARRPQPDDGRAELSTILVTVEKLVDNPVDVEAPGPRFAPGTDGAGTLTPGPSTVTTLARRPGRPGRDQTGSGRLKGRWCTGPHHVEGGRERGPGPGARGVPAGRGSSPSRMSAVRTRFWRPRDGLERVNEDATAMPASPDERAPLPTDPGLCPTLGPEFDARARRRPGLARHRAAAQRPGRHRGPRSAVAGLECGHQPDRHPPPAAIALDHVADALTAMAIVRAMDIGERPRSSILAAAPATRACRWGWRCPLDACAGRFGGQEGALPAGRRGGRRGRRVGGRRSGTAARGPRRAGRGAGA